MKRATEFILTIFCSLVMATNAFSAPQWWQQVYTPNSNGQVTLKDENNINVTAITNPTSAKVKLGANTSTQSPTIVIQATASLPIKAVGEACTANTSGTNPNQLASEGTAITADRSSLLSCQSGAWLAMSNTCPAGTKTYPATGTLCIAKRSAIDSGWTPTSPNTAAQFIEYCAARGLQPASSGILAALYTPGFTSAPAYTSFNYFVSDAFSVLSNRGSGVVGENLQNVMVGWITPPSQSGWRTQVEYASNWYSGVTSPMDVLCYR